MQQTRDGFKAGIDERALFAQTLQTMAWSGGKAVLRHTQDGYDQVKMSAFGPVVTLGRDLYMPRIERIDVVSGVPLLLVSTRASADCPRQQRLVRVSGSTSSSWLLSGACRQPVQVVVDAEGWRASSQDGNGLSWQYGASGLTRVQPQDQAPLRVGSSRRGNGTRTTGPDPSAPRQYRFSRRLEHIGKVAASGAEQVDTRQETVQPVRVSITDD